MIIADLIDREELKKSILKWLPSEDYDPERSGLRFDEDLVVSLMMEIEEQPTVDAVPVVRCKDCKHWNQDEVFKTSSCRISYDEKGFEKQTDADFFCGYGKRKDGE